jgi:hypothetical protein
MVRGLRDEFPRLKLVYVSVYESFLDLITNPVKFGEHAPISYDLCVVDQ